MADPHVVTALRKRRAELAGDIELATRHLRQLRASLEHLDATLCLFDPAAVPETIDPKVWRPKADWAKRGEMSRGVLDTLRRASGPLCSRDIAVVLMTQRSMNTDDEKLVRLVGKRVGCCLRGHRDAGHTVSEDGPGQTLVWRLASDSFPQSSENRSSIL